MGSRPLVVSYRIEGVGLVAGYGQLGTGRKRYNCGYGLLATGREL